MSLPPVACVGGLWASDLQEVSEDPRAVHSPGRWVAVLPYEGQPQFMLFSRWETERPPWAFEPWQGPERDSWTTSLDEAAYCAAVERTRSAIGLGDVYQANICRVMSSPSGETRSLIGLFDRLVSGNPSPYAALVHAPEAGIEIASASPELFLRREGDLVESGPIKGTGRTADDLLEKDSAENIMIVDLVRNDLSRVCRTGSVEVPRLLQLQQHPGLVHLVSEVRGSLEDNREWPEILDATFPPGSVTGAPKSSALSVIRRLEPVSRRYYCGALGWVADGGTRAELAVTIRTFWRESGRVNFGTGAGITWSSDPAAEWRETELKARRLIDLASDGAHEEES